MHESMKISTHSLTTRSGTCCAGTSREPRHKKRRLIHTKKPPKYGIVTRICICIKKGLTSLREPPPAPVTPDHPIIVEWRAATVTLRDETNLDIDVDSFSAGDASVDFTLTLQNRGQQCKGFVVATYVAGNESDLCVVADCCEPSYTVCGDPDTTPPFVTGSIRGFRFDGTASDSGSGIAAIELSEATNLDLDVDGFRRGRAASTSTSRSSTTVTRARATSLPLTSRATPPTSGSAPTAATRPVPAAATTPPAR